MTLANYINFQNMRGAIGGAFAGEKSIAPIVRGYEQALGIKKQGKKIATEKEVKAFFKKVAW